jgi:hypothetical protein
MLLWLQDELPLHLALTQHLVRLLQHALHLWLLDVPHLHHILPLLLLNVLHLPLVLVLVQIKEVVLIHALLDENKYLNYF